MSAILTLRELQAVLLREEEVDIAPDNDEIEPMTEQQRAILNRFQSTTYRNDGDHGNGVTRPARHNEP